MVAVVQHCSVNASKFNQVTAGHTESKDVKALSPTYDQHHVPPLSWRVFGSLYAATNSRTLLSSPLTASLKMTPATVLM